MRLLRQSGVVVDEYASLSLTIDTTCQQQLPGKFIKDTVDWEGAEV